jgi:hypothetical protein
MTNISSCLKFVKIIEALIIGIIMIIIGNIIFNLTINKKNNEKKVNKPFGLNIAFFATGFFIYLIVELIFSNKLIYG